MGDGLITLLVSGVFVGAAATITMDVLGSIAQKAALTVGVKGKWIGRWYIGIAKGQFNHTNIDSSPAHAAENRVALIGHYVVGIVLAIAYLVGADWFGVSMGNPFLAMGFGIATCVFPWFLMFPAIGFGTMGLKGPEELKLVTTSLVNHLLYGFGIWWATAALPAAFV